MNNDLQARAARCSGANLLAIIFIFAYVPLILLAVPAGIVLSGMVTNPEGIHAAWYGMLSTAGIFDPAVLTEEEKTAIVQERHYFWFGEVVSATALAGAFTVPLGMYVTAKSGSLLSFTNAAKIFLLLFIFLPKLIRKGMSTDTDTIIRLFGKNEQVNKVFWSVFIVLAVFILAQVVNPATAQEILRLLTGMGGSKFLIFFPVLKNRYPPLPTDRESKKSDPILRIVQDRPELRLDMRRDQVIPGFCQYTSIVIHRGL